MMKTFRFDEIAYNSTQKVKPTEADKEHYIGLEHIDGECLYISRWGSDVAPIGEKLVMRKGDILFGKRRAYQRKVAIAPIDGIFSAHGLVLRPKEDVVDKDYFPFFMSSNQFLDRAVQISVGGLSPTINWKDLARQEFTLPSLSEQKVLADKLWAAYRVKESYKKLLAATDDMLKAKFMEMFGEEEKNGRIADLVCGEIMSVKKTYKPEDIVSYIDISSVNAETNRIIGITDYIVKSAPSRAQQCVQYGDILVSTTRPMNRNIAIVHSKTKNLVASTGFCVLRPKEGYSDYLMTIVKSNEYTMAMCDKATGGVYPAVNNSDVLSYRIVIPTEKILTKISNIYTQAEATKESLRKSIENIDQVIKSLINQ